MKLKKKRRKEPNNIVKIKGNYKTKHLLLLFEIIFFYFNILIIYNSIYLSRKIRKNLNKKIDHNSKRS